MKERTGITLLILILLIVAGAQGYFMFFANDFTFASAELKIINNVVDEKLVFNVNEPLHTLYRNFYTKILQPNTSNEEHISVQDVTCSDGTSYYKDYYGTFISKVNPAPLIYTDKNEYGCSFGAVEGFKQDKSYTVSASYTLHPLTLFEYNGKHYIKFVAYSAGKHPFLVRGKNLVLGEDILSKGYVLPQMDAVFYVPYEPATLSPYKIEKINTLDYQIDTWIEIILFLKIFIPAIVCLILWLIFGKEKSEGDFPSELSQYPKERKAWEVSAYFHPPFGALDENFLPAMILDFYNRKIIVIDERKTGLIIKEPEIFIKIMPTNIQLDDVETKVMDFLKYIQEIENPADGFFSIKKAASGFMTAGKAKSHYEILKKEIKKKSKEHISYAGVTAVIIAICLVEFPFMLFFGETVFAYLNILIISIASTKSSLFIKFKDDYYIEYQQWQGFRKYLTTLDSIKRTPPQGVVLWEKYLVYATCMGAGKKVLEAMKNMNIIDKNTYDGYVILYSGNAFGSFTAHGRGIGGMAGGGIGGGGGGGR